MKVFDTHKSCMYVCKYIYRHTHTYCMMYTVCLEVTKYVMSLHWFCAAHFSKCHIWESSCNVLRSRRRNNKAQEHVNNITLY